MSIDDLRRDADTPGFEGESDEESLFDDFDDAEEFDDFDEARADEEQKPRQRKPFLGLTPSQRLILAMLLFFVVCISGSFCLIISGRVVP